MHADRQTQTDTDKQPGRQTDRQTQTDRQAGRQTDIADIYIHPHIHIRKQIRYILNIYIIYI